MAAPSTEESLNLYGTFSRGFVGQWKPHEKRFFSAWAYINTKSTDAQGILKPKSVIPRED